MPLPTYHLPLGPRTLPKYRLPMGPGTLPGYRLPIPDGAGGTTDILVSKAVWKSVIRVVAHFSLRPGPGALAGITGGLFVAASTIGVAAS